MPLPLMLVREVSHTVMTAIVRLEVARVWGGAASAMGIMGLGK